MATKKTTSLGLDNLVANVSTKAVTIAIPQGTKLVSDKAIEKIITDQKKYIDDRLNWFEA